MTRADLQIIGNRFNTIRPDYSIKFNSYNYLGEGYELAGFTVDSTGRVTMEIEQTYLDYMCAVRYRQLVRHPRLKKEEIEFLLKNYLQF